MALAYDMVYGAGALIASPLWAWRLARTGKWRTDWAARFGRCAPLPRDEHRRTLLIHGVSVGEVSLIRQLIATLRADHPDWRVVVSATTDTGVARARELYEPDVAVVRMPFDFTPCVQRLLRAVQPDMIALVELDVWPNLLHECSRRGVPVCVINGRLSAKSFRGYRKIKSLLKPTMRRLAAVAAQTEDYAARFRALGVPADRVHVLDSMKWDAAVITDPPGAEGAAALADAMGIDRSRPLIVAGSTAPGEEKMLIEQCPADAQLMLVPRKPERFDEVAALDDKMIRRTEHADGTTRAVDAARLFLLDTIGELKKAYALADVALIGRSFVPGFGGSDPLESIALGIPTAIGPHVDNFTEMVGALTEAGGLEQTENPGQTAAKWLADPAAARAVADAGREVIRQHQGVTQRHVDLIESLMPKEFSPQRTQRNTEAGSPDS